MAVGTGNLGVVVDFVCVLLFAVENLYCSAVDKASSESIASFG